ncbi:MAG: hypothetical protein ACE5JZ_00975 [Kiloniellales bacterium]
MAIAVCGAVPAPPGQAQEYRLSEAGAVLGASFTDGKIDDLRLVVVLDGDQAIASYVYAQIAAASFRQRTNEGYWIPWDGDRDSLIDNRFPVEDDRIVFKILDEDIGVDNQGVSIVIAYRTATAFKFGVFGVIPESGGL